MSERFVVLACGGRDFQGHREAQFIYSTLDLIHSHRRVSRLIHGDAEGADTTAADWARGLGIEIKPFPANWLDYGRAAGPIRNQQMLHEGEPDLVVAFPGGKGTDNLTEKAISTAYKVLDLRGVTNVASPGPKTKETSS